MTSDIWTEKYRPKVFADVLCQDEIVKRVEAFVNKKSMPHLLFSGPAGVGKTSLALVTVKALFGDSWRSNFLELNASDERGIDVVRNKVKDFARTRAIGDVPFKIIYLDECDALTKEAQQALRRTMENYTQTCRFVLSCNYSSKIIDPIQSRCAIFRFKLLPKQDLIKVINSIAEKENINIDDSAKEALFNICDGDCRRAENILQSSAVITDHITDEIIYSLASVARPKEIKEIIQLALNNKFIDSRKKLLDIMLEYGLSGLDIIKQIQKEVPKIDAENKKKMELIEFCGEAEFRMTEGSDEYVQLEALLAKIVLVGYK